MSNTKAKITPTERAEAVLEENTFLLLTDLSHVVDLSGVVEAELRENLERVVRAAQDIVLARLKTRAYEVRNAAHASGADGVDVAELWDAAVEVGDPARYDITWMRTWEQ